MAEFTLLVNGQSHAVEAEPDMPLLWALRDFLGLNGVKYGCGVGSCGSCTVHLDGLAARSCSVTVAAAAGKPIVTIEGLMEPDLHPLQQAWIDEDVAQCGYCQVGQIMSAAALLADIPHPSDGDIDAIMSENLCRCGTYQRIRRAIHRAANGEVQP